MPLSIRGKADTVATFRAVAVHHMETLARWVPTTPELEAKALLGRHIWEFAQHADAFGRRTAELRVALHQSRPPVAAYANVLEVLRGTASTGDRVAACYDAAIPDLIRRYQGYLDDADLLLDEPTVRILERALTDLKRMRSERDALITERPDLAACNQEAIDRLADEMAAVGDFVDYRAGTEPVATSV